MTNNLIRRIYEHKEKLVEGFSKKYNLTQLVYFETYTNPEDEILREKQIKKRKRERKINHIQKENPKRNDLYQDIIK